MNVRGLVATLLGASAICSQLPSQVRKGLEIQVGQAIFEDQNLSEPRGQACATCHQAKYGYKGNGDPSAAVIGGAVAGRFGTRKPPSAAYAFGSPSPGYQLLDGEQTYVGGQFWDGRATSLADQAKAPFLNPVEMNNPDRETVVRKVCNAKYADLFRLAYGGALCADPARYLEAYDAIASALASFESSDIVNPFSSKYDRYIDGKASLSAQERKGLSLFEGKAGCSGCHPSGRHSPFTDFTYDNLGIPKNLAHPATRVAPMDLGLGARVSSQEDGRFKVSTLRNVAIAPPYGHNGYFKTLKEIVHFYNTRDVPAAHWPAPEVLANVNRDELGNLGLTDEEEDAIVAFLKALTDEGKKPQP